MLMSKSDLKDYIVLQIKGASKYYLHRALVVYMTPVVLFFIPDNPFNSSHCSLTNFYHSPLS